jgi:hypothetical protein
MQKMGCKWGGCKMGLQGKKKEKKMAKELGLSIIII